MDVQVTLPQPDYRFKAQLYRVIDGDTYELDVKLGFQISAVVTIRLHGYNCPERNTPEGVEATLVAFELLTGKQLFLQSYKGPQSGKDVQSFARWVADVWVVDPVSGSTLLGEMLVARGVAHAIG